MKRNRATRTQPPFGQPVLAYWHNVKWGDAWNRARFIERNGKIIWESWQWLGGQFGWAETKTPDFWWVLPSTD